MYATLKVCQIISVLCIFGKQVLAHKTYAGQASFGWGSVIYLTVAAVGQTSMLRAHSFQQPHRMVSLLNLAVSPKETDEADVIETSFFCISPHFLKANKAGLVEVPCWLYSIYGLYRLIDGFCTVCFHGWNNREFPNSAFVPYAFFFIPQKGNSSPTSY